MAKDHLAASETPLRENVRHAEGTDMLSQIKEFITAAIPGRSGKMIAAAVGIAGTGLASSLVVWPTTPGNTNTLGFPFAKDQLVMVSKGLDPHGGVCAQKVSLSDPKAYGLETNEMKITNRSAPSWEATFTSDQTPGIWSTVGMGSDKVMSGAFKLKNGGQGTFKVEKDPDKPYAVGWTQFRDCVGKVELACPIVVGLNDENKGSLKLNAHLKQNCVKLELPQQVVVN